MFSCETAKDIRATSQNTMQHMATPKSMFPCEIEKDLQHHKKLQHPATHRATHYNIMQNTDTHCKTLHHTTPHCMTLQHTATPCNTLQHTATHRATHRNTLQHTDTHCKTLHHTTPHRMTLHHTATKRIRLLSLGFTVDYTQKLCTTIS